MGHVEKAPQPQNRQIETARFAVYVKQLPAFTRDQNLLVAAALREERKGDTDALRQLQFDKTFRSTMPHNQRERFGFAFAVSSTVEEFFMHGNMRLVLQQASHFMKTSLTEEDRQQHGMIGLKNAIRTYDPPKKAFSTHAVPHIRKEIQIGAAEASIISLPLNVFTHKNAIMRRAADFAEDAQRTPTEEEYYWLARPIETTAFAAKHGRKPTKEELKRLIPHNEFSITNQAIEVIYNRRDVTRYMDEPFGPRGQTVAEVLVPHEDFPVDDVLSRIVVHKAVQALAPKEQVVIKLVYFERKTHEEAAALLGTTRKTIHSRLKSAYTKMAESGELVSFVSSY